jgi:3-hydroxyisobutyrate dehydrogenase-like beta-hydroxyacid dehydrogenase
MAKDLSYAGAEGQRRGAELRTAATAEGIFRQAIAKGYGDQDFAAVIESLQSS